MSFSGRCRSWATRNHKDSGERRKHEDGAARMLTRVFAQIWVRRRRRPRGKLRGGSWSGSSGDRVHGQPDGDCEAYGQDREASGDRAEPSSVTATAKKRCRQLRRLILINDDVDCRRRSAKVEKGKEVG
ncbi:hypothetical protein TIFTF001_024027 [Ficus carica]|uniref:Uncharacterized protein n=1 Tax=Ficus carica TaxID=3494 RepID=A0AA88DD03_FICCA|nr:hypothetical protein TIFTF001_024027 [Ficus carica]